ncbi:hypothetical protein H7347_05005 [Corynebacterium sp. zg-331]|uniref:hypothetical protein n=1 Tax=unclassified Corynebacterium TaxID=2624378 RepID=UPI00128C404B|nr:MULTISPECIES: hypothetical protein [unclassified Corynebacterium]MBC3185935.1 hypothetical protein [Corynebacterium sp. zg-331]MPV52426.1 hypothetical protein [Corynebacterium sp. zg331]
MTDLHLDCSHARLLAADLARACAPSPRPPLPQPDDSPATEAFHQRLRLSVAALHERHDSLVSLGQRLAEDSLHTVACIEQTDSRLAAHLDHPDAPRP